VASETWVQFNGIERSVESGIRSSLTKAGVGIYPTDGIAAGHGIVCFSSLNDELIQLLRDIRVTTRGLVLALAISPAALHSGGAWRLLHAGAADTVAWTEDGSAAQQVRARLDRWNAVDELADYASSRVPLIGASPTWRELVRRIAEAGHFSDAPVLLIGESGTGKELLARLIHLASGRGETPRSGRELVTVDCSTIVPELSGSELFGHERGAFTGAVSAREGAFALAANGTLFLDEVGELPPVLQAQLLRAVQEKTYKKVGGNVWQNTDFRLVCATNRDLTELVDRGQFRLDLYHRLAGWVFRMPTLRDRREDILPLATHFLQEPIEFDDTVREYLVNRAYPGNIRELRQLVQRIAHRHVGHGPITAGDIPQEDRPADGELQRCWPDERFEKAIADAITMGISLKEISQATTETAIRIAVQSEQGNLQRAAKLLGVTDRALQIRRASQKDRD
jgi:transcriptional regulator with GAF, ATPase, and Fis domain